MSFAEIHEAQERNTPGRSRTTNVARFVVVVVEIFDTGDVVVFVVVVVDPEKRLTKSF